MVFTSCNICGGNEYQEICDIHISPILTPSKLVKCRKCGFFYANPRLSREDEEEYYQKYHHQAESEDYWHGGRFAVFKRALIQISRFAKSGRLIDIGCGAGYFMDLARNNGWEVKGLEMSDYFVNYAQRKMNLEVKKGNNIGDAQFEPEYFDVVVMWNVLDQIYDPRANLIELNRILKKGGYLFLRVSNLYFHLKLLRFYTRLRFLFMGIKDFPGVFHLYSFDKDSIKRLLESTGFSGVMVKREPMNINVAQFVDIFGMKKERLLRRLFDFGTAVVYLLSLGKIIMSPSLFVIARK